jgi:hypothetical protein
MEAITINEIDRTIELSAGVAWSNTPRNGQCGYRRSSGDTLSHMIIFNLLILATGTFLD